MSEAAYHAAVENRDRLRVVGGARLAGSVCVTGAKNSALKLMAAALLAEGTTTLTEVLEILDVDTMAELPPTGMHGRAGRHERAYQRP